MEVSFTRQCRARRNRMRKLLQYGGIAASIVLIAFGIGAIYSGFSGRSQVRTDLAAEQIVGTDDSTIPGQLVDTGSEAQAFAAIIRHHTLRPPAVDLLADRATRPAARPWRRPADQEAGCQSGASDLGYRDRSDDRAQHGLRRRARGYLRDRDGASLCCSAHRRTVPHPARADPGRQTGVLRHRRGGPRRVIAAPAP